MGTLACVDARTAMVGRTFRPNIAVLDTDTVTFSKHIAAILFKLKFKNVSESLNAS